MRDRVEDFMTPTPVTVAVNQPLAVAHRLMRRHRIRHLPVLEGGALVGIVSLRDLHFIETLRDVDPDDVAVREAMTDEPITVEPRSSLASAARKMAQTRAGSVVVAERGRVVGILTTVDALRALAMLLARKRTPAGRV